MFEENIIGEDVRGRRGFIRREEKMRGDNLIKEYRLCGIKDIESM